MLMPVAFKADRNIGLPISFLKKCNIQNLEQLIINNEILA
jgi:hypothetical protein